jgi:hypothetical protein
MVPVTPTQHKSLDDIASKKQYSKTKLSSGRITVKLYYTDTKAQTQIIWGERTGTSDGFMNGLVRAVNEPNSSIRRLGVIYASSRRCSKEKNCSVLNELNSFERKYFCRYVPNELTQPQILSLQFRMHNCLSSIAKYLNVQEKKAQPGRLQKEQEAGKPIPANNGIWNHFIVADNYDQTPGTETKTLDHYLLDEDIVGLIKTCFDMENDDWSSWGAQDPTTAQKYFSEPHSSTAKMELGYPDTFVDNTEETDETIAL